MAKNQFIRARVAGWEKDCIRRKADAAHMTESEADPFRIPAWKKRLCRTIKEAMENCATREEFIAFMAEYGYKVRWEPNQKYITYTTPENARCRDNKLFDQTLLRSSMDAYFDMGGCEYLESRIDATEYGELLLSLIHI